MIAQIWGRLRDGKTSRRTGMAIYAVTARSLQPVSTLIITLLAARFMLPAEYGIYSLGVVFMVFIQTMSYTGFYHFIVNSTEPDEEVLGTSFWMIIGLSIVVSVVLILAAFPLEALFDAPGLGPVIILLSSAQVLASYGAWASAALLRAQKIQTNFHVMFVQNFVALIGGVILLFYWQSLYALVAFRWIRVICASIMYVLVGMRPPGWSFSEELAKKSLRFSSGLYGSKLLGFASKYAGDILLAFFYSTSEVGLYRFGNRVATGATDALTQPMASFAVTQFGAAARGDKDFEQPLRRFVGSTALLTGMLGAAIIVFAEEAIVQFFNEAYLAALVVTYALAFRGAAGVGRWILEPVFAGVGKTGWIMIFNLGTSIATILAIVLATPFGLETLAWTQIALIFVISMGAFALMRNKAGVRVGGAVRRYFIGVFIATCYGAVIYAMHELALPLLGLDDLTQLIVGLLCALAIAPLFLVIGAKFRVFTLDVFSG